MTLFRPTAAAESDACAASDRRSVRNRVRRFRPGLATRAALTLALVGVMTACGGGGDGPASIPPGFTVALSTAALTVTAGSSATFTASVARTGSAGAVALTAEALPAGLTATFDPAEVASTTTSASLTLSAATTVTAATYAFTVRARSAGIADQIIPAAVTVRAAPAFTLAITPSNASVQAGASTQATIQLVRTEFAEAVALTIAGLPAGATGTFGASSVIGESTTMTIATTAATPVGVYPLTLRGASTLAARTATFTLTVTAPPDFAIASAAAISVRQGATSAATTVTIARTGGFAAPVTLTLEGLPAGVVPSPVSQIVAGEAAQFTFTAAANAAVGTASVVVRAKATGLPDRVATIALTVTADPGSFTVSLPASISATQGQSVGVSVAIVRLAPFTGPVTLVATGVPTGASPTFTPPTIAAGATTSALTFTIGSATVPGVYTVAIRASGAGVPDQTASISLTVTAGPSPIVTQHLLAQEGLAIALASTVLQSQLQVLFAVTTTGQGSATTCEGLPGGGSVQSLPVGADNPRKAGIYYDGACTKPYILADVSALTDVGGRVTLTETATYFGPTGTLLGVMNLQESAEVTGDPISVAGLGTFTPASGAQPVRLGLTCVLKESGGITTAPCYGGIEQYVPSLARSIGSITLLTLTIGATASDPITFTGSNSVLRTGAQGALTLSLATPTTLAINGGTVFGSSTQQGGAASFSLFPPTPTGWTVTDAEHDMRFTINVVSNTVRNSVGQITQISTGAVLATIAVDQSGTGTITWSDGRTVAVTGWTFAD